MKYPYLGFRLIRRQDKCGILYVSENEGVVVLD